MADDLAARLHAIRSRGCIAFREQPSNAELAQILVVELEAHLEEARRDLHGSRYAAHGMLVGAIIEAATRLSPPEGDKVEAVARAVCREEFATGDYSAFGDTLERAVDEGWPLFKHMAVAALAALPTSTAGKVMDGWQPIETAPATGEFLAYGNYVYPGDKDVTEYMLIAWRNSAENADAWPWETDEGNHPRDFFSHWLPLPEAPR